MPSASETMPDCAQDQLHASMISAQSVLVTGGTFNLTTTKVQASVMDHGRAIREIFEDYALHNATYDARHNDDYNFESSSQPHMAESLKSFLDWSQSADTEGTILRVSAKHGTGRSLAMSLSHVLDERRILGASYFLQFGEQSQVQKFVATLALQLMIAIPALQPSIMEAVNLNPFIFLKLPQKQADQLIVHPITSCDFDFPARIIVIHGLDKCQDIAVQCRLSSLIEYMASQLKGKLKFIVVGGRENQLDDDIRFPFDESIDTVDRLADGKSGFAHFVESPRLLVVTMQVGKHLNLSTICHMSDHFHLLGNDRNPWELVTKYACFALPNFVFLGGLVVGEWREWAELTEPLIEQSI